MNPHSYVNRWVDHQDDQPPVILQPGYDSEWLLFESVVGKDTPTTMFMSHSEFWDSWGAWLARMRWLAESRRGK